jgi:Dolichyl-phosphate-mannose-protein mannosyltransferase
MQQLVERQGEWLVRRMIPTGLFLGVLLLTGATLKDYGIAWDEPPYFHAADLHMAWIIDFGTNIDKGEIKQSLSDENIKSAWRWNPYHVPHPPFSRIVSGVTKNVFSGWLDKFSGYRLAPALFFAALVTVMFLWMRQLFGVATGLFSALALVAIPNIFGFAHIAVTDLPLASMWFLTVFCFWKGLQNWKWSVACGLVWGLGLATKFPAVLIPIPLVLWAHVFYRNRYANNVLAMLFLGPLIMIVTQPYLWHQSALRILEFLYEGLSRGYRADANFPIYFFDQLYFTHQLPWYYPFFLIGVTTPEPIIVLAAISLVSLLWIRKGTSTLMLFAFNAFFILGLGLLPGAVLHDGVRQMLPALPFLAAIAGGGFFVVGEWLLSLICRSTRLQAIANLRGKLLGVLGLLILFSPVLDLYLYHPFQLSFYNRFVGGVRGAYQRGLELTYSMEAFTPEFINAIDAKLPQNSVVNASFANFMFKYYQKEGRLRSDIKISDAEPFDYYILLNRRSVLGPRDQLLMSGSVPMFLSEQLAGVPLVAVFELNIPGR